MPNLYETAARSQIVQKYASTTGQKLTLKQMMEYGQNMTPGKLIKSARHLHRELPVRIAQRIVDFEAQVRPSLTLISTHISWICARKNAPAAFPLCSTLRVGKGGQLLQPAACRRLLVCGSPCLELRRPSFCWSHS